MSELDKKLMQTPDLKMERLEKLKTEVGNPIRSLRDEKAFFGPKKAR